MKKLLLLAFATVAAVLAIPASSFAIQPGITLVAGQVQSGGSNVHGATVTVTCNGHTLTDTTNGAGKYAVKFDSADCPSGSVVTASAVKNDLHGSNTGTADPVSG